MHYLTINESCIISCVPVKLKKNILIDLSTWEKKNESETFHCMYYRDLGAYMPIKECVIMKEV